MVPESDERRLDVVPRHDLLAGRAARDEGGHFQIAALPENPFRELDHLRAEGREEHIRRTRGQSGHALRVPAALAEGPRALPAVPRLPRLPGDARGGELHQAPGAEARAGAGEIGARTARPRGCFQPQIDTDETQI